MPFNRDFLWMVKSGDKVETEPASPKPNETVPGGSVGELENKDTTELNEAQRTELVEKMNNMMQKAYAETDKWFSDGEGHEQRHQDDLKFVKPKNPLIEIAPGYTISVQEETDQQAFKKIAMAKQPAPKILAAEQADNKLEVICLKAIVEGAELNVQYALPVGADVETFMQMRKDVLPIDVKKEMDEDLLYDLKLRFSYLKIKEIPQGVEAARRYITALNENSRTGPSQAAMREKLIMLIATDEVFRARAEIQLA